MKKLFAGLLLSLMLLSILSIPVLAASAFPFEEFKQDGWFMKQHIRTARARLVCKGFGEELRYPRECRR
ncbi:MAG: hypothetical protein II590_01230 [Clostridia bacterium]|nr:hypothetical protein [Clostridia bacterium]